MTTLNDVKAFFQDNKENSEVAEYIKSFVADERMLEHALETEKGKSFFQRSFDKKISEARSKMESNYENKLQESLTKAEQDWIEKHKKAETKSPLEIKLEEMQAKLDKQQMDLRQREIMSIVNPKIPEPLRNYTEKLIDPNWSNEDASAFTEQLSTAIASLVESKAEERLKSSNTNPGNPRGNQKTGARYSDLSAEQLAKLPDAEYMQAVKEQMNNKN